MIKVETIDNRGFLKRSWKDQRKLQSKLRIADASIFNNSPNQPTHNQTQGLKVWGSIMKFGSSIINKFRRSNPETIVNVEINNNKNNSADKVEDKSQIIEQFPKRINTNDRANIDQSWCKKSSILNISKLKQHSNSKSAFIQLPKKRKFPDSYQKNKYYVNSLNSIDSLKRNVNKRIEQSQKISKIANEQWINYTGNILNYDKDKIVKKMHNNQQTVDSGLAKLNSINELGHKPSQKDQKSMKKGEVLQWLDKIAQQNKIKKEAKLKEISQKSLPQIQTVINEKPNNGSSSLFSNQNIDNNKSNKSLFNIEEKPKSLSLFGNQLKQQSDNLDKLPILVKEPINQNKNKFLFGGIILQPENQNKQQKLKQTSLFGETKTVGLFGTSSLFPKTGGLFDNKSDKIQVKQKQKQQIQKKQQKQSGSDSHLVTPQKRQPQQSQNKQNSNKKDQPTPSKPVPLFGFPVANDSTSLLNSVVKNSEENKNQPKKQQPKPYTNIFVTPKQTKVNLNFEQLFGVSASQIPRSSNQINDPFRKPPPSFAAPAPSVLSCGNTGINTGGSGGMQTQDMMIQNSGGMNVNFGIHQTNNNLFQNPSFSQPVYNLGFSPSQAKSNFVAQMNSHNLGSGLISGAASFFQQQVEKPQGLFASPSQPKISMTSNKGKKSREQRAFQN